MRHAAVHSRRPRVAPMSSAVPLDCRSLDSAQDPVRECAENEGGEVMATRHRQVVQRRQRLRLHRTGGRRRGRVRAFFGDPDGRLSDLEARQQGQLRGGAGPEGATGAEHPPRSTPRAPPCCGAPATLGRRLQPAERPSPSKKPADRRALSARAADSEARCGVTCCRSSPGRSPSTTPASRRPSGARSRRSPSSTGSPSPSS